jgi:hypothetical protein
MKHRFVWASALALAITMSSQIQAMAITNGVIVISTRTASDALYRQISSSTLYDADDYKGPGVFSPGDTAMAILLQDHGYATRLVPEWLLRPDAIDPTTPPAYTGLSPEYYYGGGGGPSRPADTNSLYAASLVIISGSGSSADMPPPNTNGIPIIMGEHSCLGDQVLSGNSSLYLYGNKTSGNQTATATGPNQYMLVVAANHPIMQGIPLNSQGRVKIWRDPYPEENAHLPAGGSPKVNYKYSWTWVDITTSIVAPGTTVIGVMGDTTNRAVFAVNPAGSELYNTAPDPTNHGNYVHFFVNEHGSGDARRAFNALTDIGRVIFVRTCKWAMGETLTPYQPLGLIRVAQVGSQQVQLSWDGSAAKNYKILGTRNLFGPADFSNWQTVAEDILGTNGTVSARFDISGGPQYAFLRVMPVP